MSKQPNKKDKGKAVQKVEDYQLQIPVQNQFTPLTFPPLPYKNTVTNPSSSSSTNDYIICFTKHLLLTSCNPLLRQILFQVLIKRHLEQITSLRMISV